MIRLQLILARTYFSPFPTLQRNNFFLQLTYAIQQPRPFFLSCEGSIVRVDDFD
jgi:hypothetical protein